MFAIFEFSNDDSVEVGLVEWVTKVEDEDFNHETHDDPKSLIGKSVTVAWPKNGLHGKFGAKTAGVVTPFSATIRAVSGKLL